MGANAGPAPIAFEIRVSADFSRTKVTLLFVVHGVTQNGADLTPDKAREIASELLRAADALSPLPPKVPETQGGPYR